MDVWFWEGNIGVEVMFSRVETDGMIVDTGCNELLSSKKILGKQLWQIIKSVGLEVRSEEIKNDWRWEFIKQDCWVYTKEWNQARQIGRPN